MRRFLIGTLTLFGIFVFGTSCSLSAKISMEGSFSYSSGSGVANAKTDYGYAPSISGSVHDFSISPSLPPGLSINQLTGVVSGRALTPSTSVTYSVNGIDDFEKPVTGSLTLEVAGYYVVNTTADASDSNVGDGICATAAGTCSLRAAVQEAAAQTAGTLGNISVPAGTYVLTGSGLPISSRVTITGEGASSTIISGGGAVSNVVSVTTTQAVTLDSLSVQNGSHSAGATIFGIGVNSVSETFTMKNCQVSGNSATGASLTNVRGVGIYWKSTGTSGVFNLENCTISSNTDTVTAAGSGGHGIGVYVEGNGRITLSKDTITNNSVSLGGGSIATGVGLSVYAPATVSLLNTTLSSNSLVAISAGSGGAIYFQNGVTSTLDGLTCTSNSVSGGGSKISGCLVAGTGTTIRNSTFSGNTNASGQAEEAFLAGGNISISNSTFSGSSNTMVTLSSVAADATISNSTFYSSAAKDVIAVTGTPTPSIVTLEHVTVQHDNAVGYSLNLSGITSAATVVKSVHSIYDALAGTVCSGTGSATMISTGYNVARDSSCGFLSGTGDLQNSATIGLSSLASNGGLTQTMAIGASSSAYNLVPAGSCSLSTDQRGSSRPSGGACDAGAFEK